MRGRLAGLLLIAAGAAAPAQRAYEFVVDGEREPVEFCAVEWSAQQPGPGDVVWVGGFEFVLEEPGTFHFERVERNLWKVDGERRTLVGLHVRSPADVPNLTDAELHALRCVEFDHWDDGYLDLLAKVDPMRCFVRFGVFANFDELPDVPATLRYVDLEYTDLESLADLVRLRDLRFLRTPNEQGLVDVSPLASLRNLRHLQLDHSGVRDLSPLNAHPSLRVVRAAGTPLQKLPTERLTALVEMHAVDTGCPDEEISRFHELQPGLHATWSRQQDLVELAGKTSRLRLRTGSTCHPDPDEKVLFTTDDAKVIADVVALLAVPKQHRKSSLITGCENHTLEFLDGSGMRVAWIGIFDDHLIRSYDLWGTTAAHLTDASRVKLREWLLGRGAVFRR